MKVFRIMGNAEFLETSKGMDPEEKRLANYKRKEVLGPTVYIMREGFTANPLHKGRYRNWKCPCGSGDKVKFCCGIPRAMNKEQSDDLREAMRLDGV